MSTFDRIEKAKKERAEEEARAAAATSFSSGQGGMSRIEKARQDRAAEEAQAATRTATMAQEPSRSVAPAAKSQLPSAGELAWTHKTVSEELDRKNKTYEENEGTLRRILDTASYGGDLSRIASDVSKIEQVYGVSPTKSGSMSQYLSDIQKLYSAPEIGALESAQAIAAGQYYTAKNAEAQARLEADTGAKKTYEGLKDVAVSEANIRRLRDQVERGEDRAAWDADAQLVEKYFGVSPEKSGSTVQYLTDLQKLLDTDAASQLGGEMRSELEKSGYDAEGLMGYETRQKLAQKATQQQNDIAGATDKNWLSGLGMNAASVVATPLQGFEYIGQLLGNIGHNDPSKLEGYIPLDINAMPVTNTVRTIRGTTAENINNKVIRWLYENGMSIADSTAEIAAFGPAAYFIMSGSAAANQMRDVLERGGTNRQAILSGAAAGAAEMLFEKISIDKLLSQKSVTGWRSWLRETAKQAGVEASEEMFTEVANILSDAAIMGENSEFSQRVTNYTAQGLSADEAKKKAFPDSLGQVALAGAGGALSGGVMGGVVNAYNGVRTSNAQPRTFVDEMMENILGPVETQEAPARSKGEKMIAEMMDAIMGPVETETKNEAPLTIEERRAELSRRYDALNTRAEELIRERENGTDTSEAEQELFREYNAIENDRKALDAQEIQQRRIAENQTSKGINTPENHIDQRNYDDVSKTSVKAFQFDHPELHDYFAEAARALLADTEFAINTTYRDYKKGTTFKSTHQLDRAIRLGLTKPEILKVCKDIIANNGQENYAKAKKVEIILNDMLTRGYKGVNGYVEPNEAYIAAKEKINGADSAEERYVKSYQLLIDLGDVTEEEVREEFRAGKAADEQKNSAPEGAESTVINTDPTEHTAAEQKTIIEYQVAVDETVKDFFDEYLKNPNREFSRRNISSVGERQASDAHKLLGGNYVGYKNAINSNSVKHILNEHGPNGKVDHSMGDINDIARIGYVLENYDNVEVVEYASGDIDYSQEFRDKNNEPAPMLKYSKKINGTYYVVEAVPESKFQKMWVVSAYMQTDNGTQAPNANGPRNTPDASLASSLSVNPNVSQSGPSVNPETQNDGLGPADRGFSTPTRGEIVYTQNKTMNPGADFTAEESERYAPGVHESVSEEMSLERAMGRFYQDENGHFVNLEDTVDELLEKESWTGVDQDTAQVAFRWMNAHRKSLTDEQYSRFWALHKTIEEIGGSEAGRSLQARQKWVSSGDGIVSKAMSLMDDPRIDRKAAREVIDHVADLAEKYDRAVSDGNNVSFAEIVREAAAARNTAKKDGNLTRSVEWALKQILKHNDVEFMKNAARASIIAMAQDHVPTSASTKAKAIRRTFMLSKAATWSRNVDSNGVFDPIDSIARDISVPLDMLLSKFTKTRSVAADAYWFSKTKWKGTSYALARSLLEVGLDISAEGAENRYGQAGNRTFKMSGGPVERFFSRWEQLLGYAMYSTDQMKKGGIQSEVQRGIDRLYKKGKIADDSLRDAGTQEAAYRTFQADTGIAKGFLTIRQGLNKVAHIGDVGLGDFMMPFVQVPTNLVDITIDYSPAGLAKGIVGLTKTLYDAHNGTMTAAQQARAVQTIGRSLTGSSLVALAVLMRVSGVLLISDDGREEDKDKTALESQSGLSGTQINLSGLMRLLTGGKAKKQPGDKLMSIGFMDPFNALLNMGSLIADDYIAEHEGEENGITIGEIFKDTVAGTVQAAAELPMMDPFADAINAYNYSKADTVGGKLTDAGLQFATGQVTSFIPNSLKGIAQGTDTKQRDLNSSNSWFGRTWDNIKASIPGLRQTLPAKLDSYGNEIDVGDPVLNFLNNNILPGQITQYQPRNETIDPKLEELYKATGSVTQYPDRNPPSTISRDIDGDGKNEKFELTVEEKRKFQKTRGDIIEELFSEVLKEKKRLFTPEEMVDILVNIKSYAGAQAKKEFYEDHDIEADTTVSFIGKAVAGVQEAGIPFVTYLDFWCKKDNLNYEVDENGKKKVKEAVVKLIDSMRLTNAQKDWLYNKEGYKGEVTWH